MLRRTVLSTTCKAAIGLLGFESGCAESPPTVLGPVSAPVTPGRSQVITDLGRGFSSVLGNTVGESFPLGIPGVDFIIQNIPLNGIEVTREGQLKEASISYLSSYSEAENFFSVSASAHGSFASFSAAGSVSSMSSSRRTSYDIVGIVAVRVINPPARMGYARFSRRALEDLQQGSLIEFSDKYGDSFVIQQATGGMLLATCTWSARTAEEHSALMADLSASSVAWGATGNAQSRTSSLDRWTGASLRLIQIGGEGDMPPFDPGNPQRMFDALFDAAVSFPSKVSLKTGNPVYIGYDVASYAGIDNKPRTYRLDPAPAYTRSFQVKDTISDQQLAAGTFRDALNDPNKFQPVDKGSWQLGLTRSQQNLVNFGSELRLLQRNPLGRLPVPAVLLSLPPLPQLKRVPRPNLVYKATVGIASFVDPHHAAQARNGEMMNAEHAGHYGQMTMFSVEFDPPQRGLSLRYLTELSGRGRPEMRDGAASPPGNIEAVQIFLEGPLARYYDLRVRCWVDNAGWVEGHSGDFIGTTNRNGRIEAISIDIAERPNV